MKSRAIVFSIIGTILLYAAAQAYGVVPAISITSPSGGISFDKIIKIEGDVQSNSAVDECLVIANGIEYPVQLINGHFSLLTVAAPGENIIQALAHNNDGYGSDSLTTFVQIPKRDVKIVLFWDTDNTDVDLYVTNPLNERCFYRNPSTSIGDNLDVDDTDGYGPETYTLNNAIPGTYQVQIHYYADNGVPLTEADLWIVIYEGTDREEQYHYQGLLRSEGDILNIASFTITETIN